MTATAGSAQLLDPEPTGGDSLLPLQSDTPRDLGDPSDASVELVATVNERGVGRIDLVFEPPKGWHLYGPFQNGSGAAALVDWTLPPGARAGLVTWPVPERYRSADIVLDHVYFGRTVVTTRVEGLTPGSPVSASLEWLVCDDTSCVPVFHDVETVAVEDDAPAFEAGPIAWDPGSLDLEVRWSGDDLIVAADGPIAFFPAVAGSTIDGVSDSGFSETGELRLRPTWTRGDTRAATRHVIGIIATNEFATAGRDRKSTDAEKRTTGEDAARSGVAMWVVFPRNADTAEAQPWRVEGEPAFLWTK